MDIRQLRYFVALAEHLHFGRAAAWLHITQPPLSRQIAALEAELDTQLLERNSRSVVLTPAGAHFLPEARQILAAVDLAARNVRGIARGERGELRVGFTMVAAWNVLPRLLRSYSEAHPAVNLQLAEKLPRDLAKALLDGELDVGISFAWRTPTGLRYRRLFDEPLCAVLPEGHPSAESDYVPLEQLAEEPFITFPRTTAPALHEAVMGCCRAHGFTPTIRLETHLQQTIVNLVAEGLGVSLVPASLARMRLPGAVFRPLQHSPAVEQGLSWSEANANPCLGDFLRLSLAADYAHLPTGAQNGLMG